MSKRVIISETPFVDVEFQRSALEESGVELDVRETHTETAVAEALGEADALVADVHTPVTADTLEDADDLRLIARAGTGFDNVDVGAADDRDVYVTNVPDYCTDEVATHALGLLLACRRRIPAFDREIRDGEWSWETERPMRRVPGSTLGLVSFGGIARRLAEYVEGFDLDLLVYDPYVDESVVEEYGARSVEFPELLEESDAVSIHAPLTEETRGLFDADAFERLPEHAVVVNVGRGGIIDEADLATALNNGEIAAAGLDVLEEEPPGETPLRGLENVVITPHSGWHSLEAHDDLNRTIARQLEQALAGEKPDHAIDPEPWT
ncbi:C-terminal binding protein [Halobiforma nitratireducens]|uniref:D-isomer specific 2-hydroxyacid dehydrogenase NAD-binding subunit n=1 Tax=Halobiforma nitratireducens JCM 10879 TaxID=1227454 RepID=M0LPW4_9EURY|nr:C-terminal binding protein [Halobiforma nitratireducens]EMA35163.1 D-isomer specific 2-hydroxyacid dehydrogenase NAD-binding subunit [Halobiforma nitratireducens JCM 10879]